MRAKEAVAFAGRGCGQYMGKDADKSDKKRSSRRFARYILLLVMVGLLLVSWFSVLSFHPDDPPANTVWTDPPQPIHNSGGAVGANIAYLLKYWLDDGTYMLLLFGSVAAGIKLFGGTISDLPWRIIGLILMVTATSAAGHLLANSNSGGLIIGNGGVLGIATGNFLQTNFNKLSWIVLLVSFAVGVMLTADNLVLRLSAVGRKLWEKRPAVSLPVSIFRREGGGAATLSLPPLSRPSARPAVKPDRPDKDKSDKPVLATPAAAVSEKPARDMDEKPAGQPQEENLDLPMSAPVAKAPAADVVTPPATVPLEPVKLDDLDEDEQQPAAAPAADKPAPSPAEAAPAPRPILPLPAPLAQVEPKKPRILLPPPKPKTDTPGEYQLPGVDLLADPVRGAAETREASVIEKRSVLQQTLDDFGVQAQVVGHMTGPVISQFELSLAPGVKVSQISSLAMDIARALAVPGVRVVSPLPGRDTVGIEVPNLDKETVRLKELIALAPEAPEKMALPLYLGKDAAGGPIVADLASMPHLLMAGTTGSGKSVCINAIIASIMLTRNPRDVRLILIDPKMVEMAAFEKIPHLLCPIVNDMRRVEDILEWAATKMDERYELLKEAGVKNIVGFNRLGPDEVYKRLGVEDEADKPHVITHMPYFVIIIDELADLIMTASKEVEGHIIRIAQKARAVGIHLIVATQRPSVNVVTGLIKSNMPCRVSFRVASRQESRIVLDQNGADVLLGQGDMLFLQPGTSHLTRAQGAFVGEDEIRALVNHVRSAGEPEYHEELVKLQSGTAEVDAEGKDELFDQAVEIILACQRGSVSLLQRRLQVGYSRASRIVDQMAEAGILGDYKGSQARECMLTLEDWQAMKEAQQADQSGQNSADGEPTSC